VDEPAWPLLAGVTKCFSDCGCEAPGRCAPKGEERGSFPRPGSGSHHGHFRVRSPRKFAWCIVRPRKNGFFFFFDDARRDACCGVSPETPTNVSGFPRPGHVGHNNDRPIREPPRPLHNKGPAPTVCRGPKSRCLRRLFSFLLQRRINRPRENRWASSISPGKKIFGAGLVFAGTGPVVSTRAL